MKETTPLWKISNLYQVPAAEHVLCLNQGDRGNSLLKIRYCSRNLPALTGGVALVTTFVGLLVTDTLSDGLNVSGISTWIMASLIVWLCALLAGVILPLFLFKKALDTRDDRK